MAVCVTAKRRPAGETRLDPHMTHPVPTTTLTATGNPALQAWIVTRRRLPGVTSGSALLAMGTRLLSVHDDALRVTWIDPATVTLVPQVLHGDGAALPKPLRPDFEAAVAIGDGTVYLLGSGSTPARCTIARLRGASVALYGHPRLYDSVGAALGLTGRPNIEGAAVVADGLRVFHRGANGAPSAGVDLPCAVLDGGEPIVGGVLRLELGALDGVALGLTDVAVLGPDRYAFTAAAEDTADAVADGPVAGSVIGVWHEAGHASALHWVRLCHADGTPCTDKVEGLVVDADRRGGWIITDTDDPARAGELCRIVLEGFRDGCTG